jgi:hypothetical protein
MPKANESHASLARREPTDGTVNHQAEPLPNLNAVNGSGRVSCPQI